MKAKFYIVLLCSAVLTLCFSCSKEKDIYAEIEESVYDITDNPSDPIQHQRYLFYQDYRTYLITRPEIKD